MDDSGGRQRGKKPAEVIGRLGEEGQIALYDKLPEVSWTPWEGRRPGFEQGRASRRPDGRVPLRTQSRRRLVLQDHERPPASDARIQEQAHQERRLDAR